MTVIGSRGVGTDVTNAYVLKCRILMGWGFFSSVGERCNGATEVAAET